VKKGGQGVLLKEPCMDESGLVKPLVEDGNIGMLLSSSESDNNLERRLVVLRRCGIAVYISRVAIGDKLDLVPWSSNELNDSAVPRVKESTSCGGGGKLASFSVEVAFGDLFDNRSSD
jgi:hypothetical protein